MFKNKELNSKAVGLLLIEDDSFMRKMIRLVLESENYKVTGTENGEEALRLLGESNGYDAVISDMYLPDMDGITVFEKVNTTYPNLFFLILTSETDETIVQRAKKLGLTYILKDENFAESILLALKNNLY